MQSTIDIGSSARSRDQAMRQMRNRSKQEKEHQRQQLQSQNASKIQKSKHRYRPRFTAEKVDVVIQNQPVVRHPVLPQYSFNGQFDARPDKWYESRACNFQAIPPSAARPTFDIFSFKKPLTSRQINNVFRQQEYQWEDRKIVLERLFHWQLEDLMAEPISDGYTQVGGKILENIRYHATEIPEATVQKYEWKNDGSYTITTVPRHTKDVNLRQLWEASDIGDYEAADDAMGAYVDTKAYELFITLRKSGGRRH